MRSALLQLGCWVFLCLPVAAHGEEVASSLDRRIDSLFSPLVAFLVQVLFWDPVGEHGIVDLGLDARVPLVLVWLALGAVFFTFYLGFVNLRGFGHGIALIRGRYHDPSHPGQVSHFQALATALSGTVGLGNIAGVAVAMSLGGPGATFWMILLGLLGMSTKFAECTMGVKYRRIDASGKVYGGPMYYLHHGLEKRSLGGLGRILAVLFAIMCIGGSLGGGNMFQANQAYQMTAEVLPFMRENGFWFGLVMALLVGFVIIGGITGIARVTQTITPAMCLLYLGFSLFVIAVNIDKVGEAFRLILVGAMDPESVKGGFIGALIVGLQRAAFSNEAGIGSAAIAHSAVNTREPVSEGTVALLEPFTDTVVVCTMTALVLIFTGYATDPGELSGAALTNAAFVSVLPWFGWVLWLVVLLFAFSTQLAWSYYGLQAWNYLFGRHGGKPAVEISYGLLFLCCIVIGAASGLQAVLDFSDMMIITMGFPNLIGLMILAPEIRREMRSYYRRLKAGEILPVTR